MSYYGDHEQAAADAKKASKQIDGLEPGATSPVHEGGDGGKDGSAPIHLQMDRTEFTTERHHIMPITRGGNLSVSNKRELHTSPMKKKGSSTI